MNGRSWNEGWNLVDFQPPDICQAITTGTGSGVCGFNSYCKYVGSGKQSLVDCECPPGYSFLDPVRRYKGCQANFPAQSCDADEKEIGSLYDFSLPIRVDWPLSDYEHFSPVDEDKCRGEFMKNGSLTEFHFGSVRPNWNLRVQIALGIARGLTYLHEECSTQIIHCDIKPQNILLDDNLVARISDFGLAKLLRTDQTRTITGIRGTRGYVAPEWFKSMGITAKVDVYSFGVMLLEIVCCRKNVEQELGNEEAVILTYWVNDCYRDGMLELAVEGDDEAALDMKRVERFVKVALWCIQEEPSMRPTMQKVTQMLDGATSIPEPPDPSSYISSIQ